MKYQIRRAEQPVWLCYPCDLNAIDCTDSSAFLRYKGTLFLIPIQKIFGRDPPNRPAGLFVYYGGTFGSHVETKAEATLPAIRRCLGAFEPLGAFESRNGRLRKMHFFIQAGTNCFSLYMATRKKPPSLSTMSPLGVHGQSGIRTKSYLGQRAV